ncbi:magnesium transporter [Blastopirellula marina]|uniref:Magnesium transporter MgtE n=1 Tax=Blastopirellula marina DSM 3645 TaxID=314230 RepID=A3ZZV2_9BACT|nr:magnesium transporter [Blastopirellula marina]EAQ77893.1 Mg2+ transport protein [Blastopirellula marina DSM 3645]
MMNVLYLPELREMLAENDHQGLLEFCTALHPARTAEFMEALTIDEVWNVLRHADTQLQSEIFAYFEHPFQVEIIESRDPAEVAEMIACMSADDRVDLLSGVDEEAVTVILSLLPLEERRDFQRLSGHPEGTAGAIMTTEVARLSEDLTVRQALEELTRQAEHLETVYYIYIVDENDRLHGVVSTRQLVSSLGKSDRKLSELMEPEVIHCQVTEDQEEVLRKMADYDLLAIPVVDDTLQLVGIITHDDILDVVLEEAEEDAYRAAAVEPLEDSYLQTPIITLSWKRGVWLIILFIGALFTSMALGHFQEELNKFAWLVPFIPLVISTGGNTGNQSATLIIMALNKGDLTARDWFMVVRREILMGLILGSLLSILGYGIAFTEAPSAFAALVVPITVLAVVIAGTTVGSSLPLLFKSINLDPALMSNPFVAGIIDFLGIVIYMSVAILLLGD